MKFLLLCLVLTSFSAIAKDYEKMSFSSTKKGVEVKLAYKEILGIKAFLDVPTNIRFTPVVECENLGGLLFAHVKLEKSYIYKDPEKSRFRNGSLVTSHTSVRLKTHKLCDGDSVDVITVDGVNVGKFGSK